MLFFFFLMMGIISAEIITERVSVVNQLNPSSDLKNKLVVQKITDILPEVPRLYAADDFILPVNLSTNITVMQLSFTTVRLRRDADPDSITVVLMYTDPKTEGPGEVFFTKTVRAPNNPPAWHNDSLGTHDVISLNITQNEESTDQSPPVWFDFRNPVFLPRATRLWLGLYVTGARNYVKEPQEAENIVFWCTTGVKVNRTWEGSGSYLENAPYYFIDEAGIIDKRFVNWTNASRVEPVLRLKSVSLNMAWSLTLLGVEASSFFEIFSGMTSKQLIAMIICGVLGLVIVVLCAWCVCKRCRRCHCWRRWSSSSSGGLKTYDMSRPSSSSLPNGGLDTQSGDILLEGESSTASGYDVGLDSKSTGSSKFLYNLVNTPVQARPSSPPTKDNKNKGD